MAIRKKRILTDKKWIVFDFDGTIAETTGALLDFFNKEIAKRYKCRIINPDDLPKIQDMTAKQKLSYMRIPFYKLPFVVSRARKVFPTLIEHLPTIDGLEEVCQELIKEGYLLAILSSNKVENIRKYLDKNSLAYLFEEVRCDKGRSLFVKHKTIRRFIKKMRIARSNMIYIGDEGRDVKACDRIGVDVISVTWGWDSKKVLNKLNPSRLANTPQELLEVIHKIRESK